MYDCFSPSSAWLPPARRAKYSEPKALSIITKPKFRFKCKICGEGFQTRRETERHMQHHSTKLCQQKLREIRCLDCGREFETYSTLTWHRRKSGHRPILISEPWVITSDESRIYML